MKIRCLPVMLAASALSAPSLVVPASHAGDQAVKNGSFDQAIQTDPVWFRADPCLERESPMGSDCDPALPSRPVEAGRFISIGPSIVHVPENIEPGNLPLPLGLEGLAGSCVVGAQERLSVLRMRVNSPDALFEDWFVGRLADGIGNVYQTDIFLTGMEGEVLDGHAVVLRFDHLGLHPTGGSALKVRLIAERIRDEDGDAVEALDWGSTPDLMPFRDDYGATYHAFEMKSLGSAFFEQCDGDIRRMPRKLPFDCTEIQPDCDGSSCEDDSSATELIGSILRPESHADEMPFAGWRTNELKVAVKRLPDWNCAGGLDQLDDYRFTIAFALPKERVYLGPESLDDCQFVDDMLSTRSPSHFRASLLMPAYSEIDAVELGVAEVGEGRFHACDYRSDGSCTERPDSNDECWATQGTGGEPFPTTCGYRPLEGGRPLEWDSMVGGQTPVATGVDSQRNPVRLVYSPSEASGHWVGVGSSCENGRTATHRRRMSEVAFTLVDFLEPDSVCLGDFNRDGRVDGLDFGVLLGQFGCSSDCVADLDGDGKVDGSDVGRFFGRWGSCS